MPYSLIIFDFDGTLADSAAWFVDALKQLALNHRFGPIDDQKIEELRLCGNREIIRRLRIPLWRLPFMAAELRTRMAGDVEQIRPFDGIPQVLTTLAQAKLATAVVSSNSETNVRAILGPETAGAVSHMACGAGLFGKSAKLKKIMRQAAVPPSKTLCIGDEQRDIEAARRIGAAAGAVLWGYANPELLRQCRPDILFERPDDIVSRIIGPTCPAAA